MSLNPYTPTISTLGNGVTLLNAPSSSRNVGVFLIVRAGSRDETADTSGLAHYLEHMFFKGTERRPTTKVISREIDRLGANTNAYTDTEEVAYFAEGPALALGELADVIADMLSRPLFAAEEVERERNVVLQELSARLSDPDGWIWDRLGTVAFGGDQPMAWSAAGFPAVIEKATREQLIKYHRSFYAPKSMCLVIAGGGSLTDEDAERLLADIPRGKPRPRVPAKWGQGDRYTANVRPVTADEEPQVRMVFAVPGIPALDPDRTALSVMTHILGGGMSSRLFHTVRERNGLCYSIFSHHEGFDDTGLFAISTATRPKDARRATELSFAEFRKLAATRVNAGELAATCAGHDRPAAALDRDGHGQRAVLRNTLARRASTGDPGCSRRGDRQDHRRAGPQRGGTDRGRHRRRAPRIGRARRPGRRAAGGNSAGGCQAPAHIPSLISRSCSRPRRM